MNHLLGSLVMALALVLANPIAVAQEPGAATPASAATTDAVPSIEGSMWEGTDSQGDFAQYTFLKGGQVRVRSANALGTELESTETKGDSWAQDGSSIRFEMNHFVTCVGTIAGDHISGNATTVKGEHWTWNLNRTTVVAKSVPIEPTPNASGPAEAIEITLAADRSYSWRGRTWHAGELKGQLFQESHLHPISEVRFLAPPGQTSIANVIEISRMAQVVRAKPVFLETAESDKAIAVPASSSDVPQFEFAGRTLMLPVPAGQCALSRDSEQGRKLYDEQQEQAKGIGKFAVAFADCAALKKRERDPKDKIPKFGQYVIPVMDGKESSFPPEVTPAVYIQAAVDGADVATVEKAADEKLQAFAASPSADGRLKTGPLSYDENAVYLGLIMPVREGEDAKLCAVIGVTIVNRVLVTLTLYGDYVDANSFHSLLAEQKVNFKALFAANSK